MNSKHTKLWAAIFGCALLGATDTKAINITVPDYAGPHTFRAPNTLYPGDPGYAGDPANTWNGGGTLATAYEDNETEQVLNGSRALRGQHWDLEAFVVQGSKLIMIGGFDFENGWGNPLQNPGDLFIKVGAPTPGYQPVTGSPATVSNDAYYDYTYAIRLGGNLASGSAPVIDFQTADATLETAIYDQFRANPWRYLSGGTSAGSVAINYRPGLTWEEIQDDYQVLLAGDGEVSVDGTPSYELHNALEIDMSFLAGLGSVDLSYTMECGNDSLKGFNEGGFTIVPDGGMSLALLGMGISGLLLAARGRK